MTIIQSRDLHKATVTVAFAIVLAAAVNGAPAEAQTFPTTVENCIPEADANVSQDADVVVDQAAIEQRRIDKAESTARKFKVLTHQWREERGSMSAIDEMSMLPSYQNIIGLGPDALPMILSELKAEGDDPDQWFWALLSIGEANDLNPPRVAPEDQGNFKKMADAWLAWGETRGYAI
jgi:hypothetical protein